jgi:hypothetical protein
MAIGVEIEGSACASCRECAQPVSLRRIATGVEDSKNYYNIPIKYRKRQMDVVSHKLHVCVVFVLFILQGAALNMRGCQCPSSSPKAA